jgi:hypothetical protein
MLIFHVNCGIKVFTFQKLDNVNYTSDFLK